MVFGEHRSSGESLVDFSTWDTYLHHDSVRYIFVQANWDVGMVCRGYTVYAHHEDIRVVRYIQLSYFRATVCSDCSNSHQSPLCFTSFDLLLLYATLIYACRWYFKQFWQIYIYITFSFRIYIWRIEYFLSLNILLYVLYIYICTYNIQYILYIYMYIKHKTRRNSKENIQFVDLWTS